MKSDFVDHLNEKFEEIYSNLDKIEAKINQQSESLLILAQIFESLLQEQRENSGGKMTVERFVIQNFKDWEAKAQESGQSYADPEYRKKQAKDIAMGCFHSEEEILKALEGYVSYE